MLFLVSGLIVITRDEHRALTGVHQNVILRRLLVQIIAITIVSITLWYSGV